MKQTLLLFFLVFYVLLLTKAQDTLATVYFDKNWQETKEGRDAAFYRKLIRHKQFYYCYDYYISGQLQMSGCCGDKNCEIKLDTFRYYYPNGQLKRQESYRNNLMYGKSSGYFEDGLLDYVCHYKETTHKCVYYHRNGNVSAIEEFEHDTVLIAAKLWESSGEVSTNNVLIKTPTLEGFETEESFKEFLKKTMYFPEDPQGNRIYGDIHFYIIIDTTGKAHWGDYFGFADPYLALDIQRVVKKMPLWSPALIHNRKSEYHISIRLRFIDQ